MSRMSMVGSMTRMRRMYSGGKICMSSWSYWFHIDLFHEMRWFLQSSLLHSFRIHSLILLIPEIIKIFGLQNRISTFVQLSSSYNYTECTTWHWIVYSSKLQFSRLIIKFKKNESLKKYCMWKKLKLVRRKWRGTLCTSLLILSINSIFSDSESLMALFD